MPPRKNTSDHSAAIAGPVAKASNPAIMSAIAQLEKSFGKGTVMRMGDKPDVQIEAISTGSIGLDAALGIGGVPKGRIIEIYGPEASGKCTPKDTLLLSDSGLLSVEEFFAARGFTATCTTKIVPHETSLVNENGEWEATSHLTWNGNREVRRIRTSIGSELGVTLRHPIRVMDDTGFIAWRTGDDVREGDIVPVMRGTEAYPASDMISEDEARLLGYLVADGHNKSSSQATFSNSDHEVVSYRENEAGVAVDHRLNSTEFRTELFERLGYDMSATKQVPVPVRRSGKAVQLAFLSGYMELECSMDLKNRCVEVTSTSRLLLQQVQAMLLNMGVVSALSPKPVDGKDCWCLTASGGQGYALVQMLAFSTTARQEVANQFASETKGSTNIDSVPFQGPMLRALYHWCTEKDERLSDMVCDYMGDLPRARLTYPRLRMIVDAIETSQGVGSHPILLHFRDILDSNHFYATVESIENTVEPTFDVCMPRTHSFWSSGLISHNTTLALHIIAEAQKAGGTCAFVDAEHALDTSYARKLGVDVDNLFLSQPDHGEQALEVVDVLVRSGGLSVIVIDSVAALTPRAEIEGEMGDSHMGLHARLMSQALRKLTGNISRSNCTVIFLNQIRMKIGVVFGNPETTTGGNALKFYASVRMEIRRIGALKEKDEVVGHQARVKVIKNKVAPPFRQAEFDIMFGYGISKTGELVDLGVKAGLVEKAGAWYSTDSTRIGQGRDNSKQFLADHPDIADALEKKIRGGRAELSIEVSPEGDEADEGDEGEE